VRWLSALLAVAAVGALSGSAARADGATAAARAGGPPAGQVALTAPDGAAGDLAGRAVAIGGGAAVVGAPFHAVGGRAAQGAAYVFTAANSWARPAELVASDGEADDQFGSAVALDGPIALVGAPHRSEGANRLEGAVYVFTRRGSAWIQTAELTTPDGGVSDEFGAAVALSGDLAVVGAPYHAVGSSIEQGAAYVFHWDGSSWSEVAELTAADGGEYDNLGIAVAVSGPTVVVGSDDHQVGRNEEQGAAYVFEQRGASWTQAAELVGADGKPEDFFGSSVAVSGRAVVVGAPDDSAGSLRPVGEADVFTRSGREWTQTAALVATPARGARRTSFGCSVSVAPGLVVVGGEGHQVAGHREQGLAYVFTGGGSSWSAAGQLSADDGGQYDNLGAAVALWGHAAIAGAPGHGTDGRRSQGAAYVFADLP
jgi:FG-GAP repeat